MQGLSNNIIELQLYSNQHLTTCILTFEEYASFHQHVRDVEDVCPSLTAHSFLKSTAATCEHPSPSLHLIKDGKNILHVHPLHYTLLVLSSYYNYYLPCLASADTTSPSILTTIQVSWALSGLLWLELTKAFIRQSLPHGLSNCKQKTVLTCPFWK